MLKIIDLLSQKTKTISEESLNVYSETAELPGVPEKTVKTYKPKPAPKDKRINSIADPQYEKFKNCENLKNTIEEYNSTIEKYEKNVSNYNNLLEDRKKITTSAPNCQLLKSANEKLMNLYYRIEQNKNSNLSALQAEYLKIKEQTEVNEKCKEYAAYKEWCKGIDKLLKK